VLKKIRDSKAVHRTVLALISLVCGIAVTHFLISMIIAITGSSTDNILEHLTDQSQFLFHIPLFLIFVAIFNRNISFRVTMAAFAGAYLSNTFGVFDVWAHELFVTLGVYPGALSHGDELGFINPQYAKLLLYSVSLPTLVYISFKRKGRSLDRIFVILISLASLGTTALFHSVTAIGGVDDFNERNGIVLLSIIEADKANLMMLCDRLELSCFEISESEIFTKSTANINQEVQRIHQHMLEAGQPYSRHVWHSLVTLTGSSRGHQIAYAKNPGVYRIIIDQKGFLHSLNRNQLYFSVLSLFAHLVWVFGGLSVLFFHHNRFAKRANANRIFNVDT